MPLRRCHPARRRSVVLIALALVSVLIGACETAPILRGSGSEHRQAIRVGLPF